MLNKNSPYRIISLLLVGVVSGCMVGPDYRNPVLTPHAAWQNTGSTTFDTSSSDPALLARWWQALKDPLLTSLVEESARNNLDYKLAMARLREARARRGYASSDRYPTVNLGGGVARNQSSDDTGGGRTSDSFSAKLDASWEADIFGGKQRATESANATVEAAVENANDVRISLLAEVVLAYLEIRSTQNRMIFTHNSIANLEETLQMTSWRYQAGLVTRLDEEQARLNLEQTRAQLPPLESSLATSRNNLTLLLGRDSGTLKELDAIAPLPSSPARLAVGIPAETLRRRPDVRKAERELAAATAQIGVAEAQRYPDLTLSGTLGLQSKNLGSLFQPGAIMYALAANSLMTIFDGGRLKQQVEIQNALQEQSLISYKKSVQSALRDTENALSAYASELNRRTSLSKALASATTAARLAENQYQAGLVDFTTVLDSQRSLLTLQDQLIQSDAAVTSNLARLYKTLGGGWEYGVTNNPQTAATASGEKQ